VNRRKLSVQANERLLHALAEQMKLPLLQTARSAELARLTGQPLIQLDTIELTADTALKLLDNYLLSLRLARSAVLEPVSVSAVLNSAAHQLSKLAKQYQCELQLHLSGKYEPIIADFVGLESALTSLGYVFIEASNAAAHEHPPVIKLAAHRGKKGIVAGMFIDTEGLSSDMFRRAHELYGRARQPLAGLTATSGAGVFVAESLLNTMSVRLRPAHHQKLSGLAATFLPSQQLQLI
jgi:hypothetical protein